MDALKVVQIINTLDHADGGPARNAYELHQALNSLANTSARLYWLKGKPDSAIPFLHKVTIPREPLLTKVSGRSSPSKLRSSATEVVRQIARSDAVLLHGFFLGWVPIFFVVGKLAGTRIYITPHGSLTPYEMKKKARKKKLFLALFGKLMLANSDCVIVGSVQEKSDIEHQFPGVTAAVGGVGTALGMTAASPRGLGEVVRLGVMSRIAAKKRMDLVIDATEILFARGLPVSLAIAGSGDLQLEQGLRKQASAVPEGLHINFLGELTGDSKNEFLNGLDIFVLPSEDENFGIVVPEALAAGVPVVTSENVASAKLVDSRAAEIVPKLDARDVADAISRVLTRHGPELRAHCRSEAERAYSWPTIAQQWRRVLAADSRETVYIKAG